MRASDHSLWFPLWLSAVAMSAACSAPHKLISARHTSCPVRELEIRDLVSAPNREDWIAVCREHSFACSTREKGRRLIYACRPLADAGTNNASHGDASLTHEDSPASESGTAQSSNDTGDAARDAAVAVDASAGAP